MGDYKPPFMVTDKMISYISSISEKNWSYYSNEQSGIQTSFEKK